MNDFEIVYNALTRARKNGNETEFVIMVMCEMKINPTLTVNEVVDICMDKLKIRLC